MSRPRFYYTVTEQTDEGDLLPFVYVYPTLARAKAAVAEVFDEYVNYAGDDAIELTWARDRANCFLGYTDREGFSQFVVQRVQLAPGKRRAKPAARPVSINT